MSNLSNAPRRVAPGAATPVTSTAAAAAAAAAEAEAEAAAATPMAMEAGTSVAVVAPPMATSVLAARLNADNTVTSCALAMEEPMAATSCPDSPIRRVSSSLKNSALDFASRFFKKCKAATFTVDGATYTIVLDTQLVQQQEKQD
ncbi:hypothetical protein AWZ03_008822 [Drosophila navojoa]|uniref:Uncharacterized protein n=1 Tax=Drosophila navojoa TaxID=7232 RepID=A0A484B7F4_DRONA|nr:hypothetical protein AWZ03_008822 [Drosophila navojoa]